VAHGQAPLAFPPKAVQAPSRIGKEELEMWDPLSSCLEKLPSPAASVFSTLKKSSHRSCSVTYFNAGRSLPPRPSRAGPPHTLHRVEFDEGDLGALLRVLDSGPSVELALEVLTLDGD
jgi:hypothetical protein